MDSINCNPPFVVDRIKFKNNIFQIVRDDLIVGGTAIRGLIKLMSKTQNKEYVHACHNNCYLQISLAYAAYISGNTCTLIIPDLEMHPFTERAELYYGAKIIKIKDGYLKTLEKAADEYMTCETSNKIRLPFSLGKDYAKDAIKCISYHININPKRIWVLDCSGSLLDILYQIFPDTHFCVIRVGKPSNTIIESRTTIYTSVDNFCDKSEFEPPYPSLSTYDAKMWVFIMQYGEDGDFIWNSGCDDLEI